MAYFPVSLNIYNKKILIVGGGKIAFDKLSKLVNFTKDITILSKEFNQEIISLSKEYNLNLIEKSYQEGDIKGYDIIIVATYEKLQKEIFIESRSYNILVNSVDNTSYCDFIFPSFIKKGDLIVSISTSGSSPAFSKYFKIFLEKIIPNSVEEFLKEMKNYRKTMPKGKERMEFLDKKAKEFVGGFYGK